MSDQLQTKKKIQEILATKSSVSRKYLQKEVNDAIYSPVLKTFVPIGMECYIGKSPTPTA